jgi:hypothetical protein
MLKNSPACIAFAALVVRCASTAAAGPSAVAGLAPTGGNGAKGAGDIRIGKT